MAANMQTAATIAIADRDRGGLWASLIFTVPQTVVAPTGARPDADKHS
ncbi:hypothetical protein [uncultured Mycobacterium sp.]